MSSRKGQPSPANTFLDTIIRKFDGQDRSFIFVNAEPSSHPIIFCNDGFCELTGFSRGEVMQKNGDCSFLRGPHTSDASIACLQAGLSGDDELQLDMELCSKEGKRISCNVLLAPVRNERFQVIMFILDFEDITNEPTILEPLRKKHNGVTTLTSMISRKLRSVKGSARPATLSTEERDVTDVDLNNQCLPNTAGSDSAAVPASAEVRKLEKLSVFSRRKLESKVATRLADKDGSFYGPIQMPAITYTSAGADSGSMSTGGYSSGLHGASSYSPSAASTAIMQSYAPRRGSDDCGGQIVGKPSSPNIKLQLKGNEVVSRDILASTQPSKPSRLDIPQKAGQVQSLSPNLSATDHKLQSDKVHRCVILHYSIAKTIWDWLVLILVLYTAISTPYSAAFLLGEKAKLSASNSYQDDPFAIFDLIIDIIFITDVLINFRTTYVNKHEEIVSDPGKLAIHYFKGWFLIDMLTAIPFDLLLIGSKADEVVAMLLELLKTVRLLRLAHVAPMLGHYSENGAAVLLLLMSTFTLFAHWFACIFYAIAVTERPFLPEPRIGWIDMLSEQMHKPINDSDPLSGPSLSSKYITSLYFTFSSLTSVGFGNIAPNTDAEKVFAIVMMLLGSLMYASIFGIVSAIIQRLYSGTARYHNELSRVKEFIRFHQVINPLRQRLEEYFQHAWTYTNGIDMNMVLKDFPECLQADICLHLNNNLLSNCPAFEGASPGCLRALSMKFHTIHVPPGDILVHQGDVLNALYFISRGSIEIVKGDHVMAVLGKGDIFGEHICKYRTVGKSSCNVRALIYSDLHKVLREDLIEVLQMYPEFTDTFERNLEVTFSLRDQSLTRWRCMDELLIRNSDEAELMASGRSRWKVLFRRLAGNQGCTCPANCETHPDQNSSGKGTTDTTSAGKNASNKGILEFSPTMAGQDVTPLNLTFGGSTKKSLRASLAEALGTVTPGGHQKQQQTRRIGDADEEKMALLPNNESTQPSRSTLDEGGGSSGGVPSFTEPCTAVDNGGDLINLGYQSPVNAGSSHNHPPSSAAALSVAAAPPAPAVLEHKNKVLDQAEEKLILMARHLDQLEKKLATDLQLVLLLVKQKMALSDRSAADQSIESSP